MARKLRVAAAMAASIALIVAACSASQATGGTRSASCRVGVWAEDFTDAGHLAWQVSLGAPDGDGGPPVQPVVARTPAGAVAVFTDGDVLYGLRLAGGHQVWHRALGAFVDLQAWHGTVLALVYVGGKAPRLVSLDAATGAVRWTVSLGSGPLGTGTFAVTSDGVAVVAADGTVNIETRGKTLAGIDVATGERLWTRRYLSVPRVQVSGTVVVIATTTSSDSWATVTGLQGRTAKTLWSRTGFQNSASILSAPGGRVLVDNADVPLAPSSGKVVVFPVIALSAVTGATLWQARAPARSMPAQTVPPQVTAVWVAPAGVLISNSEDGGSSASPGVRLYLADLRTGKVRWSVPSNVNANVAPVITATDVIATVTGASKGVVVDYSARDGAVRWKAPATYRYGYASNLAWPAGPNVLFTLWMQQKPSQLHALNVATGATRATTLLPFTSTVDAPMTVTGHDALVAAETTSCSPGGILK